ncbi:phosphatase PAP2 family protein [Halomarina oriensis]|uniref:Phosphatase PAP2 family protein n=1 Tax=Halomarina oriensis TaxID=671145 RepID=A0A6B0GR61_9EURY|nr:phosphatase PAP2 family protein [Halomarina oriensis]MWG35867.1 phosphatase PAP2 family protein [Halomarina oriensis]
MVPLQPATQYVVGMTAAALAAFVLGARVFLPDVRPLAFAREFLRTDWRYIGLAWVVTFCVNELAHRFHADRTFTSHVYELEGSAVASFQSVVGVAPEWVTYSLTAFFTVAYLVAFPFIVLFTYFKLKAHDETQARRYAMAYVALVLAAVPFFLLFPVGIPGLYLPVVDPLMLEFDPVIRAGVLATDTLVKAFPSLHTGLSVLAALYARNATENYARVVSVLAFVIVLSTLYLGIHWLTDALAAAVLATGVYWFSQRIDPDRINPIARGD